MRICYQVLKKTVSRSQPRPTPAQVMMNRHLEMQKLARQNSKDASKVCYVTWISRTEHCWLNVVFFNGGHFKATHEAVGISVFNYTAACI